MTTPLFSAYAPGENRVAATLLAVLERLRPALIEHILDTLLGNANNPPIEYATLESLKEARKTSQLANI